MYDHKALVEAAWRGNSLNDVPVYIYCRLVRIECPDCGHHHDCDENAALNIRDEAVRIYCTS